MKRLHVHLGVDDLAASIRFYSTLFAVEPTVRKPAGAAAGCCTPALAPVPKSACFCGAAAAE